MADIPASLLIPEDMDQDALARFVHYVVTHGGYVENAAGQPVPRTQVSEMLDLVLRFEIAWREHPDHYPTFPPAAMSVWTHEPYKGHTESYVMGGMTDVTSPAHLKWGKRSLGEFAGIRPVPPELPVSSERESFLSFSLKGSGKAFRARRELKLLLPSKYRPFVTKARSFAREKKYGVYKSLVGGSVNPPITDEYKRTTAEEYRFRLFAQHYGDQLAGVENFIRLRDFWNCATGKVHPDHVIDYFTHQLALL